jgi:carbon-monoxide dehydrogenase medium subunit
VELAGRGSRRLLPAQDFFQDWYLTALEPGEMVTAVILPKPQAGAHGVYIKHARVAGDYATASVAACVSGPGHIRVAVGACGPVPIRDDEADALLSEDRSESALTRAAALLQARADPLDDVRGSADYRRALIPRLLLRAVRQLALPSGALQ